MKLDIAAVTACIVAGLVATSPSLRAQPAKTGIVKLGINDALSGNFVTIGTPPTSAARMAVKEINDKGGFVVGDTTYTFQLVEIDNQSSVPNAVAGMIKLVEDDKVKYVYGPSEGGAFADQTAEITASAGVLQMAPAPGWQAPGYLTETTRPLIFVTDPPNALPASIDAIGLQKLGATSVAFMAVDNDTTKANIPPFMAATKAAGIRAVTILFPVGTTDFTSYVTRAKGENVDAVFFLYPQSATADVMRTVIDLDAAPKGFAGFNIDPNLALTGMRGKPLQIPFFTTQSTPSYYFPANDKIKAFAERMRAVAPNLGVTANFVFFSYDFVYMLAEAMKQAGTVDDPAKVARALSSMTYDGVAGKIRFPDGHRISVYDLGLIFVRDGEIDSQIFPSSCKS